MDCWPAPSRVFEKAWAARAELHRILAAQPGAVGIVSRFDDATGEWMGTPFRPTETARQWWEHVTDAHRISSDDLALFDFGGGAA